MKKIKMILWTLLIAIWGAGNSLSHEPSYISLSFDPGAENLRIMVLHKVGENLGHFVRRIDVIINHEEVESMIFDGQRGADSVYVDYAVEESDVRHILVVAYCNIYGTIRGQLNVEENLGRYTSDNYQNGEMEFEMELPPYYTAPQDIRAPSDMGTHDMEPGFGGEKGLYDAEPDLQQFDMGDDFYE